MTARRLALALLPLLSVTLPACWGDISSSPPVHLNQNMDFQKRFEMQEVNPFFADHRAMRPEVPGTVAVGSLKIDDHLFRGKQLKVRKPGSKAPAPTTEAERYGDARELPPKDEFGQPIKADALFLARGQQRFNIYCAACHGGTGAANGIIINHGMVSPPEFWEQRLLGAPLGHFFDVITNGQGNMPPYASQIPVRDRWAIASYVRVLQRRRAATLAQIPKAEAVAHGWSTK